MSTKVPIAICGAPDKPLKIGKDIEIPCYVLENEKRVLVLSGMIKALDMKPGTAAKSQIDAEEPARKYPEVHDPDVAANEQTPPDRPEPKRADFPFKTALRTDGLRRIVQRVVAGGTEGMIAEGSAVHDRFETPGGADFGSWADITWHTPPRRRARARLRRSPP